MIELWRSPAGVLHAEKRCRRNGRPLDTARVELDRDDVRAARVCPCAERRAEQYLLQPLTGR